MAENVMDQIVAELRDRATELYPAAGELRNIRIVGHTPKTDHFIYDVVADFATGSERIAAKVYRANKRGPQAMRDQASAEFKNLERTHRLFSESNLPGVPRPLGNFSALGAVVSEKIQGIPLQSMIMKAALLPGYDDTWLPEAAAKAGEWLRNFHKLTADAPQPFDANVLLGELENLCLSCRGEGLDDAAIRMILTGAKNTLAKTKKSVPSSAVLNDFTPLNVVVTENGVGVCDYGRMTNHGVSYNDTATFLASVEALEKYPFCNRTITTKVQESFIEAYGANPSELAVIRVLKMRTLLSMFAQGRGVRESAVRKKVMWATVMKRFIQQAASRSVAPAA